MVSIWKIERHKGSVGKILVFLSLMVVSGCSLDKKESDNKAVSETKVKNEQMDGQEKIFARTDSLPENSFRVDSLRIDINTDGINEMIALFVDAERDRKRIFWEDGHQWWLTVRFDSETFVLFNKFIPFGTAKFWVVEEDNYHILVLSDSPHFLEMVSFQYLKEEDAFTRNTVLELQGNVLYRTPDRLFN